MQDKDYIEGLRKGDNRVIRTIYERFSARCGMYVLKKGGTPDDAGDVFQDALMIILRKVQAPDFKLTSNFYTYLYGVNKLVWYNLSRKKSRSNVTIPDDNTLRDTQSIEQELLDREMDTIFRQHFNQMGIICRKLLQLFFDKNDMRTIAKKLDLKNEGNARIKKYRCRAALKKAIEADPRYKEMVV